MNPYRGDTHITLGVNTYALRPSFGALAEMEGRLGIGILQLAIKFQTGRVSLREAVEVLACGIRGAGGQVPADIGDQVLRSGIEKPLLELSKWLAAALEGEPSTQSEEPNAHEGDGGKA